MSDFVSELTSLLNRHSKENGSGTPDFILAEYLWGCLSHFNAAVNRREAWYGVNRIRYSGCRCVMTERMNEPVTDTLRDRLKL